MNRYLELSTQFEIAMQQLAQLDEEYKEKIKGDVYRKRKAQLIEKLQDLKRKVTNIGVQGNICHVHGKRKRPNRKNNQVMIQESFNLYFVNISEDEASALVKIHVKNVVSYTIKFIKPGIILTV